MASGSISFVGIVIRIVISIALVLVTYNPSGHSFVHWVFTDLSTFDPLKAFLGVLILVAWVVFVRTARTALGTLGILLSALLLGTLVWLLFGLHLLSNAGSSTMVWIVLVATGIVLGIGLSWSLIRQRATGQVEAS